MKIKKTRFFPTVTGEVFGFMQSHSVAASWSTEIALTSCEYCNVCDSLCKATSGWSTYAPRLYCEHMFYSCWHNVYGDQKVSTVYPDQATAASCTHSYRKPHAASCNYQGITCTQCGMGDPGPGGGTSGEVVGGRTRKRILDPLEFHEDDNNARRPGISDWQETLKSIGVPNKKGFITMEGGHQKQWELEDIDQGLAADFDDSLSGLGVDISTASYNMSEALLALPAVPIFKQEALSPSGQDKHNTSSNPATFDESSQSNTTDRLFRLLSSDNLTDCPSPSIHQLLQQHITPGITQGTTSHVTSHGASSSACLQTCHHSQQSTVQNNTSDSAQESVTLSNHGMSYEDNRFQYILGAATSVATKVNEESLSYLNQGQSYEIKVKKLGDLTRCKGKFYHTIIRVCFHERHLQYMEKEQLESWRHMRPGERILEVDIPLSYGICDVAQDPKSLNMCEFDWDPTKEVGVYIKVNCISTEFTPKKHGGEKGVPFRIQVETYSKTECGQEQLHVCACQIKVFKLKGADRKHKQDREKISKRPHYEQEKYQPSCECTILTELSPEAVYVPAAESSASTPSSNAGLRTQSPASVLKNESGGIDQTKLENGVPTDQEEDQENPVRKRFPITSDVSFKGKIKNRKLYGVPLHSGTTAVQTMAWLAANRFNKYHNMFANFTGTDILRLSRSDLIEMCGLADGIRLFNALHAKNVLPRLTVYVCLEHEQLYHAVYLENLTCADFTKKVSSLMQITQERIHDVYLQGPSGIHILVTDEVVQNMVNESMLSIKVLQDTTGERYRLLLRLNDNHSSKTQS
ncbi:transcription factor CP2-like protein 1 isoform X4 [Penaeus chinensis]|uniref:transcription factor CP2-like protein 1 isoform X4 n=1 Tax=Penaeus chinensis TaxID=139456 RepID=UPI001FB67442|nr:transcription factor CP2-like protein 1 isoform X4 [Penaeus chinensis]